MLKSLTGVMSWPTAAKGEDPSKNFKTADDMGDGGVKASAGLMDGVADSVGKTDESTADGTEDRFLKLLVAQMRNQDPMNPMENAEVTSQLAQISTVRGIESLNKSMASFTASAAQNTALASISMIGKKVLAPGDRFAHDSSAKGEDRLGFELNAKASNVRVDLQNDRGEIIYSQQMSNLDAGAHSLAWDGKDGNGRAVGSGMMRMSVTATDDGTAVESKTLVPVTVTGVAQTNTGAMLELDHAKPVSPADARLII
ncbi:MAG: flagellar hook capping FlgD N-terminal domain-containing protein [Lautropia sp.]|nr:flagellar hook capping FlgD N-terminal domain-containing protein [Lautropia sp.]